MELKEFVSSTLIQIAEGIKEAQEEAERLECQFSPRHVPKENDKNVHQRFSSDSLECVNFDVALAIKNTVEASGKAKILVASGDLSGQHEKENISKISFPIYVQWPRQK